MRVQGEHTTNQYVLGKILRNILFFLCVLLVAPRAAFAADLMLSPSTASFDVGQTFNVRVEVNPDGESVNAVETALKFDADKLTVTALSKTGSAFSLWTTEPEFLNSAGTINFGGGSPTPFSKTSTILTITFKAKAVGTAEVSFTEGSVLAADGKGTDVLAAMKKSTYTIAEAEVVPPQPTGDLPPAPDVESSSHPDENAWYQENTAEFTWKIPNGVDTVRLLLGSKPDSTPTVPYTPPIDTRIIDKLDEGVSYFHVQFKNASGWGPITHRKLQIDYSPPEPFDINVVESSSSTTPPSLEFGTTDAVSGIKDYTISIDGDEAGTFTEEDLDKLPNRAFEMPRLLDGSYLVTVTATDLAGNSTESDVTVTLATGNVPASETPTETVVEKQPLNWWFIVSIILFLILLFLIGIIYVQRQRFLKERDYLRRETREVRDKMEKIFSVLQDELEEQIASLDNKPRLSANEKRVLNSLREALEVSEAFINKEIEDVEKVLR